MHFKRFKNILNYYVVLFFISKTRVRLIFWKIIDTNFKTYKPYFRTNYTACDHDNVYASIALTTTPKKKCIFFFFFYAHGGTEKTFLINFISYRSIRFTWKNCCTRCTRSVVRYWHTKVTLKIDSYERYQRV